jgi:flagellar motor switch protein FliM
MALERTLSQEEIDAVFSASRNPGGETDVATGSDLYNFGRSDRIPKPQLKAIQALHENFARDLTIALSAYLRDYVVVNIITVEHIFFAEFLESLPSPTSLISLRVQPFGECSVLELSPAVCWAVVEILMGGHARSPSKLKRKLTEIEQSILDGMIRLILNNLRAAWRPTYDLEFTIDSQETDPQVFRVMAPNDGVVAVAIEVRIGENVGMMNIAMNSLTIARLREKFDHNKSYKKVAGADEQSLRLKLLNRATFEVEAYLCASPLRVSDLLQVEVGDVLAFDVPVDRPVGLLLNRQGKFRGQVVTSGNKRALLVEGRAEQDAAPPAPGRCVDVFRGGTA